MSQAGKLGTDDVGDLGCLAGGNAGDEKDLSASALGVEAGSSAGVGREIFESQKVGGGDGNFGFDVAVVIAASDELPDGDREAGGGDVDPVEGKPSENDDKDGHEDMVACGPSPDQCNQEGCRRRDEVAPSGLIAVDELQLAGKLDGSEFGAA